METPRLAGGFQILYEAIKQRAPDKRAGGTNETKAKKDEDGAES